MWECWVYLFSSIATVIAGILIMNFEDFEIPTRIILAVLAVLAYGLAFGVPLITGQLKF